MRLRGIASAAISLTVRLHMPIVKATCPAAEAARVGRVDLVVQSTDKNFGVPVSRWAPRDGSTKTPHLKTPARLRGRGITVAALSLLLPAFAGGG